MKKICLYSILISLVIFCHGISYSADDEAMRHLQPQEPPTQRHQTPEETHATHPSSDSSLFSAGFSYSVPSYSGTACE